MTKKTSAKYSPEVRARAVRMVLEHQGEYVSQWSAIVSIASKIGCTGETLPSCPTMWDHLTIPPLRPIAS